jgi:predicted TIM-barrel fold metal-dependent hydrolase
MTMRRLLAIVLFSPALAFAQSVPAPIIDVHLHANPVDAQGPPPVAICDGFDFWPTVDPKEMADYPRRFAKEPECSRPLWSEPDQEKLMTRSIEVLRRRNIYAVTSGPADLVRKWVAFDKRRVIPALDFTLTPNAPKVAELRPLFEKKEFLVFGEVGNQYVGIAPHHEGFEPYLAMAEELDVPVAIHVGPGPPGTPYLDPATKDYRASLHSPLMLENVLRRHPKLRLYVMHAGWPMLDDMLAMLYTYPQLYVDTGVIDHAFPRAEFYRYLRALVEAGFGKRIMFGSDQMVWPQTIEIAIERIESAPFLSDAQKRDILYNNAARFLRLSDEEKARQKAGK